MPRTMITAEQRDTVTPLLQTLSATAAALSGQLKDLGLSSYGSDTERALQDLRASINAVSSSVDRHVPYRAADQLTVDEGGEASFYDDLVDAIIADTDNHQAGELIVERLRAQNIATPGVTWDCESGGCAFYADSAAQADPVLAAIDALAAEFTAARNAT